MDYDEESVLTKYICNHYQHLMTDFERKTIDVISKRMKAEAATSEEITRMTLEKWGSMDDVEVNEALVNGYQAYQQRVRDRVLKDHTKDVFINRCPQCNRIVRTPEAKLCLWCGHSWFEKS